MIRRETTSDGLRGIASVRGISRARTMWSPTPQLRVR